MDYSIYIVPELQAYLSPSQLLSAEVSYIFTVSQGCPSGVLFSLGAPQFQLILEVVGPRVVLRRNNDAAILELDPKARQTAILAMWGPDSLALANIKNPTDEGIQTKSTPVPNSLIKWARQQAYLPRQAYQSEANLFQAVCEHFRLAARKVTDGAALAAFWNTTYNGNKITSRTPKRETELQEVIGLLFQDLEVQGLDVVKEPQIGNGRMDYRISGNVNSSLVSVCVEVKLAHAADLNHGLAVQLPEYMRRTGSDYGLFVVLDFGPGYPVKDPIQLRHLPHDPDRTLAFLLPLACTESGRSINHVVFELYPKASPSKM